VGGRRADWHLCTCRSVLGLLLTPPSWLLCPALPCIRPAGSSSTRPPWLLPMSGAQARSSQMQPSMRQQRCVGGAAQQGARLGGHMRQRPECQQAAGAQQISQPCVVAGVGAWSCFSHHCLFFHPCLSIPPLPLPPSPAAAGVRPRVLPHSRQPAVRRCRQGARGQHRSHGRRAQRQVSKQLNWAGLGWGDVWYRPG
jgi:hypothetical protein